MMPGWPPRIESQLRARHPLIESRNPMMIKASIPFRSRAESGVRFPLDISQYFSAKIGIIPIGYAEFLPVGIRVLYKKDGGVRYKPLAGRFPATRK